MEYGLRLAEPEISFADPRRLCPQKIAEMLPEGRLSAVYFGTEFCQDLLPTFSTAQGFCQLAQTHDLEAVLLTPPVRTDGVCETEKLVGQLLGAGFSPTLVANDFGVLHMLRRKYPQLKCQAGRLMNRTLRDPRLADQAKAAASMETPRGEKLRSFFVTLGVKGLETDVDLEGRYLGIGHEKLQRTLHLPYSFAASGRNCLMKAEALPKTNFAALLDQPCAKFCEQRWHAETRADVDFPLWRAGNTLFYEAPASMVAVHVRHAERIVIHPRPLP